MRSGSSLGVLLALAVAAVVAGCGSAREVEATGPFTDVTRPNIVYVLTDDLSDDLIEFMPNVQKLMTRGASFTNYFVSDSLCCPSRASIFTGQLPHNTGVYTNIYPHGGVYAFAVHNNAQKTFAVTLSAQGYRTALMGKYLNGYRADSGAVPMGWTDWAATAKGYQGFDYTLNINGTPQFFGEQETDYLTDVIAQRGEEFIDAMATQEAPFFIELATFTPHRPSVPAPRHVGLFENVIAPRSPAYDRAIENAPRWLAGRLPRSQATIDRIDARYRQRARSIVSVDEMVGRLVQHLEANGQMDNTYFIFNSDNGYHMGEHRLLPGKLTAYDTDIRVPLVVVGPNVPAGLQIDAVSQNTDLAPTFEELAGALPRPDVDGRSLVSLLHGEPVPSDWRTSALVEHRHTVKAANDPDEQTEASGDPPTYKAMRTSRFTYVEYRDGEREYYNDRLDPDQLRNAYIDLSRARRKRLHAQLRRLARCDGAVECASRFAVRAAPTGKKDRKQRRRRR
jgi:arylsulfatase A-like enzyme